MYIKIVATYIPQETWYDPWGQRQHIQAKLQPTQKKTFESETHILFAHLDQTTSKLLLMYLVLKKKDYIANQNLVHAYMSKRDVWDL